MSGGSHDPSVVVHQEHGGGLEAHWDSMRLLAPLQLPRSKVHSSPSECPERNQRSCRGAMHHHYHVHQCEPWGLAAPRACQCLIHQSTARKCPRTWLLPLCPVTYSCVRTPGVVLLCECAVTSVGIFQFCPCQSLLAHLRFQVSSLSH